MDDTEIGPEKEKEKANTTDRDIKKKKVRRGQKIKNKLKNFQVFYLNIRGLKSKFSSLLTKIEEEEPTIFCITETHLLEEEDVKVDGYKLYRNDRNNVGGGVMIGVKMELENITTLVNKSNDVGETLWILIDNNRIKLRVGIIYAPQESRTPKEKLESMYEKIDEQILLAKAKEQKLLILGDFNCKIGKEIIGNRVDVTKGGRMLLKMTKRNKLSILNAHNKCKGLWTRVEGSTKSVIDYVMMDEDDGEALQEMIIDEQKEYAPCGQDYKMSDHNVINAKFDWIITEIVQQRKDRAVITEKGYCRIKEELEHVKASKIMDGDDLQDSYDKWKDTVNDIVKKNTTTLKRKNPRKSIKELIREKKKLKEIMKKIGKDDRNALIGRVKLINEKIQNESNAQYQNKMEKVVEKLQRKNGIRGPSMWEVLKQVKRKNIEPPTAIKDKEGNLLEDREEIKDRYLQHFTEILQPPKAESEEELKQEEIINAAFANIINMANNSGTTLTTIEEVEEAISELKKGKCKDGYGWNNEIIINGGKEMSISIHKIINRIETEKMVPSQWNEVDIKTVPKPGSVVDMDNKRGLFITEVLSKIYEKIIKKRNEEKINKHISSYQAGGVKERSTVDHIIVMSEVIRKNKKMGKKTYIVYGDAVKCFDKLWLKDTLVELYKAGCSPQDIQMIHEMNKNTVISVKTPSGQTEKAIIGEVVKQGTILGPTLCCVETDKINDVGEDQERSIDGGVIGILVFVDDVMSVGTAEDARKCIRNLHVMEILKKFTYGLKKTKFMVINSGKEGTEEIHEQVKEGYVEECEMYKYLGLWISKQGDCLLHIKKKDEKIKGEIAAIKSIANYHNLGPAFVKVRLQLYESCIIPSLLFNLEGWSKLGNSELKKLESVQLKSLCTLLEIPKTTPYLGLLNELGICTIAERMKHRKIILYHNIMNSDDKRLVKNIISEQTKMNEQNTFYADVAQMASSLGINIVGVEKMSKFKLQNLLRAKTNNNMGELVGNSLGLRKMRFVNKPSTFARKEYVTTMGGYETIDILKIRLNMLKIYGNYKHELSLPRLCYYCNEEDDTTEHLVSCKVMGIENLDSEHLHNENDCGLWTQVLEIVRFNMGNRKGNVPIK